MRQYTDWLSKWTSMANKQKQVRLITSEVTLENFEKSLTVKAEQNKKNFSP